MILLTSFLDSTSTFGFTFLLLNFTCGIEFSSLRSHSIEVDAGTLPRIIRDPDLLSSSDPERAEKAQNKMISPKEVFIHGTDRIVA